MSAMQDMVFRPLESGEQSLVEGLVATAVVDDPQSESWGVENHALPAHPGRGWGVFIRDGLAGALWVRDPAGGVAEISALVLPRGRWGMGLPVWMAEQVSRRLGGVELRVRVKHGGRALGESLEDAGFAGPDVEDETYPAGEWTRAAPSPA